MFNEWTLLSDNLQLMVSRAALRYAAEAIAAQADLLAREIDMGALSDQGGAEALRLLAAVVRAGGGDRLEVAGHA